jgi:Zn-dependent protease with chaperone function
MATASSLEAGFEALKQQRYDDAIAILEAFCRDSEPGKARLQAQMYLVKAYERSGSIDQAIALAQQLSYSDNSQVQSWAAETLASLQAASVRTPVTASATAPAAISLASTSSAAAKAGRAALAGVTLTMRGAGNLALASGVTLSLLVGMVFVLILAVGLMSSSNAPGLGLAIAVGLAIAFNAAVFFLSPWLMDMMQRWLYQTRWISAAELQELSPESASLIERVCRDRKLKQPRLGLIEDENPTAFTYGSLPNSARLVVSRGLFTYLDDDEIATVYAHEMGHIVHWDFAVMTLASTLVQITYLIYVFARSIGRSGGDKVKSAAQSAAFAAYAFYIIGTYLVLYLSRTREYFADHFAAENTGNPNGLSRALVKIAYGIVEEGSRQKEPSRLLEGTRALGIYDAKAAPTTGTAYRVAATPEKIGRVFLWDLFNPWGWWMELNSTHPLTGKRVRALSTYAEQLGLETEFDMGRVVGEGRSLNKRRLYGSFVRDLIIYRADLLGLIFGFLIALVYYAQTLNSVPLVTFTLIGAGAGLLIKAAVMYPKFAQAPQSDILTLMSDPYASPLRGQPVQLTGELIGRGDSGYVFGSDLKLQDPTGMLYLHYASRFGAIGNFLFGSKRVQGLIGTRGQAIGWFRRGMMPWMDLVRFTTEGGTIVNSYHRFWSVAIGLFLIALAIVLGTFVLPL